MVILVPHFLLIHRIFHLSIVPLPSLSTAAGAAAAAPPSPQSEPLEPPEPPKSPPRHRASPPKPAPFELPWARCAVGMGVARPSGQGAKWECAPGQRGGAMHVTAETAHGVCELTWK